VLFQLWETIMGEFTRFTFASNSSRVRRPCAATLDRRGCNGDSVRLERYSAASPSIWR